MSDFLHFTPSRPLRIASRGSALALAQVVLTENALKAAYPGLPMERVILQTTGDRFQGPLAEIGGKALFTKEIDEALLDNRADIAVHSLKDVPGEMPEPLTLAACLEREDARDVLLFERTHLASIHDLPANATLATSSPRRALQAQLLRPDLSIVPMRGNVQSRIDKVESGQYQSSILASAGMNRLDIPVQAYLPYPEMMPAVGQGIVAIACRKQDEGLVEYLSAIRHTQSWHALQAERAMLIALEGTCRSPIAAWANIDEGYMILHGYLAAADGSKHARTHVIGTVNDAASMGRELAAKLLAEVPHAQYA